MPIDKTDFADNLSHLMQERGVTVHELAEYCDVPEISIRKWATGKSTPRWNMAFKLASFFQLSLADLYTVENASKD